MKHWIILAALLPLSVLADKPSEPPTAADPSSSAVAHGGHAQAGAISASGAIATGGNGGAANAEALGGAGGSAAAEQSQSQTQSANASNAGNQQALTVNSHYEQKRQAPNVYAPAVYASGPCAYGWSAGASIPGAGASFGRAKPDENCDRRELARVLTPLNPHLALKLLCADPLIRDLYADNPQAAEIECVYYQPPLIITTVSDAASNAPETRDPPYVTRDELQRAFEKSVAK